MAMAQRAPLGQGMSISRHCVPPSPSLPLQRGPQPIFSSAGSWDASILPGMLGIENCRCFLGLNYTDPIRLHPAVI